MRLNLSSLENGSAATGGNEFGGVLATDTDLLAMEFPTCNDVSHPHPIPSPLDPLCRDPPDSPRSSL